MGCCQRGAGVQSPWTRWQRERGELEPERGGHPVQRQLRSLPVFRRIDVTRGLSACYDLLRSLANIMTDWSSLASEYHQARLGLFFGTRIRACFFSILFFLDRVFNIRQGFGSADGQDDPSSRQLYSDSDEEKSKSPVLALAEYRALQSVDTYITTI